MASSNFSLMEIEQICIVLDVLRESEYGIRRKRIYSSTVFEGLAHSPHVPGNSPKNKLDHVRTEFGYRRLGGFLVDHSDLLGLQQLGKQSNRMSYYLDLTVNAHANLHTIARNQGAEQNYNHALGRVSPQTRMLSGSTSSSSPARSPNNGSSNTNLGQLPPYLDADNNPTYFAKEHAQFVDSILACIYDYTIDKVDAETLAKTLSDLHKQDICNVVSEIMMKAAQ